MSDDPKCPRCGTKLPTVTVRRLVPYPVSSDFNTKPQVVIGEPKHLLHRWEEVEETGECVRCTGSY